MDLGLSGKVAIVAASSKGLGKAVAMELAKEGAKVALCARSNDALEATVEEIRQQTKAEVYWQVVDVSKQNQVQRFVKAVAERFGHIDVLVTNAGGPPTGQFLDLSHDDWDNAVQTTLMSVIYFCREVIPIMQQQQDGRIINITSVSVKQPLDNLILSNSIRAAVIGLAKTLANELGSDNILVNNVCPGYTLTDRVKTLAASQAKKDHMNPDNIIAKWADLTPLGRVAHPKEFANLVVFLASSMSSYITGTTIQVDGGLSRGLL